MANRKKPAPRKQPDDDCGCSVVLRLERPGLIACGEYRAGVNYTITDPVEAQRLQEVKGFKRVSASTED